MMMPLSTTHLCSRAPRPISQLGMMTLSVTDEKLCVRTPEKSRLRCSDDPDTMQPPATSEEVADPRRPSSLCTNLAGGVTSE